MLSQFREASVIVVPRIGDRATQAVRGFLERISLPKSKPQRLPLFKRQIVRGSL